MDNKVVTKENIKSAEESKQRIDFISWLQFIGVLAVIFGHSMNSIDVADWLKDVKAWIYTFHMPLFFFVSAYLFTVKGGYDRGYKKVLVNRFKRLLIPYFIWNIVFFLPKVVMAPYVNNQISLTLEYFLKINLSPRENILGHTWFLFALFEMFLIAIFFDKLRRNKYTWLPVGMFLTVIYCFGITDKFLAVGDLMKNAVFFWGGFLLGSIELDKVLCFHENRGLFYTFSLNILVLSVVWYMKRDMLVNTLMLGISIIAFLILLQQKLNIKSTLIDFVSINSFGIYILHWPAMMAVRFLVKNKLHLEPHLCMLAMLIGGILIPILIVLIIRKIKNKYINILKKYLLGFS